MNWINRADKAPEEKAQIIVRLIDRKMDYTHAYIYVREIELLEGLFDEWKYASDDEISEFGKIDCAYLKKYEEKMSEEIKKKAAKKKSTRLTAAKIERIVRDEFKKSYSKLKNMEIKLDRLVRKHDARMYQFGKLKGVVTEQMQRYMDKMESVEDTFFTLYHNIKKNQFLYADKPEAWWKDYLDLKHHYIEELKIESDIKDN